MSMDDLWHITAMITVILTSYIWFPFFLMLAFVIIGSLLFGIILLVAYIIDEFNKFKWFLKRKFKKDVYHKN